MPDASKPATPPPTPQKPAAPAPLQASSIDEVVEKAEDRLIPRGATVRVSPQHPELQRKAQMEELSDSLEACGIKLVTDASLAPSAIAIDPPAPAAPKK